MIPRTVHQTAPTKAVTFEERRLIARASRLLTGWRFHLWDDNDNSRLVAEHFPDLADRYEAIARGVAKADIARCVYLHAFGGVYMDTDYKLLRAFPQDVLEAECVLPISRDDDIDSPEFRVCNSVMASAPGYPLWADFIRHVFDRLETETLREDRIEKVTGPEGLTDFVKANLGRYEGLRFPPRRFFHPLITKHGLSFDKSFPSYGAHLCWGSWRTKSPIRAAKTLLVRKVTAFT